jgi:hypothetical protein
MFGASATVLLADTCLPVAATAPIAIAHTALSKISLASDAWDQCPHAAHGYMMDEIHTLHLSICCMRFENLVIEVCIIQEYTMVRFGLVLARLRVRDCRDGTTLFQRDRSRSGGRYRCKQHLHTIYFYKSSR